MEKRNDCVAVDGSASPEGTKFHDLLREGTTYTVERAGEEGWCFVRVPLESHEMAILKRVS